MCVGDKDPVQFSRIQHLDVVCQQHLLAEQQDDDVTPLDFHTAD